MPENLDLRPTNVAVIQYACESSVALNLEKAVSYIKEAVRQQAEIICLQELATSPYFPANINDSSAQKYSEKIPGRTTQILSKLAEENQVVIVGGSLYERVGKNSNVYYNGSPIIDTDGTIVGIHRKSHIPSDPGFMENQYFTAGDKAVTVADTKKGKIAVGICYDQWFPEVASAASSKGAELLLYPTAIGNIATPEIEQIPGDNGKWDIKLLNTLAGQAASGNMYVAMANRVGVEGEIDFFGQSAIFDFNGERMCIAEKTKEGIAIATCNLGVIKDLKRLWGFESTRRPDLYK